ncbi:sulfite exporter TauE/SafE family protein, partial [Pelagibacteraceae bacterium]|nr:sulfite exporter TauE/SafE family protein [Pelagibacteraceae bacterium]
MIESLDSNQIIFVLTLMVLSAVVVGFLAGFFGIGGGLIMVPILFYIFNFIGIEKTFVMHMAVGTSFLIIIPNSIISTITHMKFKAVDFSLVKTFGVFVMIGVIIGTIFAISLKTSSLILFFSIMTMIFAIYFLIEKEKVKTTPKKINLIYRIILGFLSGFLS